jgi:hypothetical protein
MKIRLTNTEEGVAGVYRRLDRADARLIRQFRHRFKM